MHSYMYQVNDKDDVEVRCVIRCTLSCFSDEIRQKMVTKYLNNPDYNFEKVNRASQACGPMVKWAIAQVRPTSSCN